MVISSNSLPFSGALVNCQSACHYSYHSLSVGKAFLWPGSKGPARKKHRREKKFIRRSTCFSAQWGGRIGHSAGSPYKGITPFLREKMLARPVQEMKHALWFLRAGPLLSGRAMLEIQWGYAYPFKREVRKPATPFCPGS
jgi:hypothetical protein